MVFPIRIERALNVSVQRGPALQRDRFGKNVSRNVLSQLSQIASVVAAIPAFILMLPGLAAVEFANYCERKRRDSTQNA
jgi:hypothetical protein